MKENTKKPTRKDKESQPLREDLKIRVLEAKKKLPNSGVVPFFLKLNPAYDNVKGKSRVTNVLQTKVTDESITYLLEKMVGMVDNNTVTLEQIASSEQE